MGKIIVTGGAGFIGSHLVEHLVDLGKEVIVLDNFSTGAVKNLASCVKKITLINCDLADYRKLFFWARKFVDIDYFFHLAALPRMGRSVDFPVQTHHANVTATLCSLELAKRLGVRKFIYTSSSSVYGVQKKLPITEDQSPNPQNPYAVQKLAGELYCSNYSKVFGLPVIVFRLFNVYGPRMQGKGGYGLVFSVWAEQKRRGFPLTIYGDGRQTRDFTHVSDVVGGLVAGMAYKKRTPFEIFNLGAGRGVTINHLAGLFGHPVVYCPARRNEERFKEADITRAKRFLGWEPRVKIEEGARELFR